MTILNEKIVNTVKQLRFASQNMPRIWDGRSAILEVNYPKLKHWGSPLKI